MMNVAGNTNDRLGTTFKILYFVAKKNEWSFGSVFKILYFPVRKQMAVWVQL